MKIWNKNFNKSTWNKPWLYSAIETKKKTEHTVRMNRNRRMCKKSLIKALHLKTTGRHFQPFYNCLQQHTTIYDQIISYFAHSMINYNSVKRWFKFIALKDDWIKMTKNLSHYAVKLLNFTVHCFFLFEHAKRYPIFGKWNLFKFVFKATTSQKSNKFPKIIINCTHALLLCHS